MKLASVLIAGAVGIFVGAVLVEVLHKVRPDLMKEIGASTKRTFDLIGDAFKEGYQGKAAPAEKAKG